MDHLTTTDRWEVTNNFWDRWEGQGQIRDVSAYLGTATQARRVTFGSILGTRATVYYTKHLGTKQFYGKTLSA